MHLLLIIKEKIKEKVDTNDFKDIKQERVIRKDYNE